VIKGLKSKEYDILVIGGGATGTGVAMDAATRGLNVALVERDDFAAGVEPRAAVRPRWEGALPRRRGARVHRGPPGHWPPPVTFLGAHTPLLPAGDGAPPFNRTSTPSQPFWPHPRTGTSSRSTKLIHGGIRYLAQAFQTKLPPNTLLDIVWNLRLPIPGTEGYEYLKILNADLYERK